MGKVSLSTPTVPFGGLRGPDGPWGSGAYGAPRTKEGKRYPHKGLDFLALPGQIVLSPLPAKIIHIGIAYPDSDLASLHLSGTGDYKGLGVKILYALPLGTLKVGALLEQGQSVATVQNVAAYHHTKHPGWPLMKNHIHVEVAVLRKDGTWEIVNPAPYLAPTEIV